MTPRKPPRMFADDQHPGANPKRVAASKKLWADPKKRAHMLKRQAAGWAAVALAKRQMATLTAERDELRAEVARLRQQLAAGQT